MIEYKSLNDQVYEEIKTRIVTNFYQPGQKLDVDQLAQELKVSRTPVTNSLKALEKDGYVTIFQRSGSYVRKFSREEIEALFEVREALEGVVVQRAIKCADQNVLINYIERFKNHLYNNTTSSIRELLLTFDAIQLEFHKYLWALCPQIIYNEILNVMLLTRQITIRHVDFCAEQKKAHDFLRNEVLIHIDIADAILSGDVGKARRSIMRDVSTTKLDILEYYDEIERFSLK